MCTRISAAQGKYDEAEPLYKEALAIRKKVFGDEHPSVAESLNNLAGLLYSQGKINEAIPYFKETITIFKKVYGDEHPNVATALNNLAELLRAQVRTFLTIPRCLFFVLWSKFSYC